MKTRFLKTSAAVLVTALWSLAGAQTAPAERKARVEKLDINGDGLISRDEAAKAPRLEKQFDAIDSNKDGQLSRDELAAFSAQTAPADRRAPVERLDINGDGLISRDEAAKAPRLGEQFDAIDSNKDGQLSRDELAAFRKAHGRPHGKGEPSGPSPQPGA